MGELSVWAWRRRQADCRTERRQRTCGAVSPSWRGPTPPSAADRLENVDGDQCRSFRRQDLDRDEPRVDPQLFVSTPGSPDRRRPEETERSRDPALANRGWAQ